MTRPDQVQELINAATEVVHGYFSEFESYKFETKLRAKIINLREKIQPLLNPTFSDGRGNKFEVLKNGIQRMETL